MGNRIIPFGTYQGKTVQEIINTNPDYILWLSENRTDFNLTEEEITNAYYHSNHFVVQSKTSVDCGINSFYGF